MTTAATQKKKRRKMKQMQGLLLLARPQHPQHHHQQHVAVGARVVFAPAKKVLVALQPQQLQLAYSAQDDQDMAHILGRIDLRGAQLEQLPDGFVIHERSANGGKKVKLQDRDRATTDAWFFGVYAAITEFTRLPIPACEYQSPRFAAVVSASLVDEVTDELELELACQLLLPARPLEKPSVRWKTWKTVAQLQALDDDLRVLYGAAMKKLPFPRERKRDALFGGLRKKHSQELRAQQLALYIDKVFELTGASTEPAFLARVQDFLDFDSFFEIKPEAVEGDNGSEPSSELYETQLEAAAIECGPTTEFIKDEALSSVYSEPPRSVVPTSSNTSLAFDLTSSENVASLARSNSSSSVQLDDVGTEFVEIVPETDPKAAKRLHKQVLERVRERVTHDDDRVREFQDQTRDFGRDALSATEYCAFLLGAFGSKECCQLIPMMARLLPDDAKRNALMDARSAIWRRTVQRTRRRRSKQFSESVVYQQQRNEVLHDAAVEAAAAGTQRKLRPKSDSLTALQWRQDASAATRHSMVETPTSAASFVPRSRSSSHAAFASTSNQESGIDTAAPAPAYKKPLLDPRRKLQHRASFNHQFNDAVADVIQEETPTAFDSDDDDDVGDNNRNELPGRPHSSSSARATATGSGEAAGRSAWPTLERTSSLAGSSASHLDEHGNEYGDDDRNTTANYRLRRTSLKTELESAPLPVEDENPVLARLRKQGAVNFMMR